MYLLHVPRADCDPFVLICTLPELTLSAALEVLSVLSPLMSSALFCSSKIPLPVSPIHYIQ